MCTSECADVWLSDQTFDWNVMVMGDSDSAVMTGVEQIVAIGALNTEVALLTLKDLLFKCQETGCECVCSSTHSWSSSFALGGAGANF